MTPQNEPQEALTPSPETELRAEVERDVENAYPILSRRNLALRANLEAAELDLRATKARAEAAESRVKELETELKEQHEEFNKVIEAISRQRDEKKWALRAVEVRIKEFEKIINPDGTLSSEEIVDELKDMVNVFEHSAYIRKTEDQLTAETKKREAILKLFSQIADKAYCDALDLHKRTECLGADAKMKDGSFGRRELDELLRAERLLGKHYGIYEALKSIPSTNSPITGSKLVVPPEVATVAKSATVPPEVVEKVVEALKALEQMVLSGRDHSCSFKIADEALALVEKVRKG